MLTHVFTRHAGHWRSRDELISDVLLHMAVQKQDDQLEYTYSSSGDTVCSPEDLPEAMNDGEKGSGISVLVARHDVFLHIKYMTCKHFVDTTTLKMVPSKPMYYKRSFVYSLNVKKVYFIHR